MSFALAPIFRPPHRAPPASFTSWVPIRSLGRAHRGRIRDHLVSLPPADRYLRFGHAATDAQIGRYVDSIDFKHDEVFGIFNRRLVLIAWAHLAFGRPAPWPAMVEFGVSVLPRARCRGFGMRLFEHASIRARNRSTDTLFIHALSENTAMLKIARRAGATVERDGSDARARLKLPRDTFVSRVTQTLEHRAGGFDYHVKRQLRRLQRWVRIAREIHGELRHYRRTHSFHTGE